MILLRDLEIFIRPRNPRPLAPEDIEIRLDGIRYVGKGSWKEREVGKS